MLTRSKTGCGAARADFGRFGALAATPPECLRQKGPCGKNRPPEGAFWPILYSRACCRSSVVEHSIGNGEVDSSILSGSTIYLAEFVIIYLTDLRSLFGMNA